MKDPKQKPVVDEAMLRQFAHGQLDEDTEDKIVALLEKKPELQAKVAAISIDPVIQKMRAHSQVVAARSLSSQFTESQDSTKGTESEATAPLDIPAELESLSEFRVIKELGRGGMGVVYLAQNKWMGNRKEVLKVLNERLIGNEDAKLRFQKEIEITAKLDHPTIVKSHSVRPLESVIVFSMEYVQGKNAFDFISENGKLPVNVACGIAMDVCAGLQHAMKKGAVHRDIKPTNIMLFRGEDKKIHAKILDFGLARVASSGQSRGLTQDGTLLGTLEYIAPEQSLDANKADIRADIYSLGCTLYHMLVGHPPFSGSIGELIMAHSQTLAPSVNLVQPSVPAELGNVVAKMLAKQPDRRFQTPNEVADALKPFLRTSASNSLMDLPAGKPAAPETTGPEAEAFRDTSVDIKVPHQNQIQMEKSIRPTPVTHEQFEATAEAALTQISVSAGAKSLSPRRRPTLSSRIPKFSKPTWVLIATGLFVAMILGGLAFSILKIKTPNGTIVIENLPKDAEVLVDGDRVDISWDSGKARLTASAGEREIRVVRNGLEVESEKKILVKSNSETAFVVQFDEDIALTETGTNKLGFHQDETKEDSILKNNPAVPARLSGSSPKEAWTIIGEEIRIVGPEKYKRQGVYFGDPEWSNYDFSAEINIEKLGGVGFSIGSKNKDQDRWMFEFCAFGNKNNTFLVACIKGRNRWTDPSCSRLRNVLDVQFDHWYSFLAKVRGTTIEIYVDGNLVCKSRHDKLDGGRCGLHAYGMPIARYRNLKVSSEDGVPLWQGLPDLKNALYVPLPENKRWIINYSAADTDTYAKQLSFFSIDIGVVTPGNKSIKRLVDPGGARRVISFENNMYASPPFFHPKKSFLKAWDRALAERAGIDTNAALTFLLYNNQTRQIIRAAEATKLQELGKTLADVKNTNFKVVPSGNGYKFEVTDIIYR